MSGIPGSTACGGFSSSPFGNDPMSSIFGGQSQSTQGQSALSGFNAPGQGGPLPGFDTDEAGAIT